ncbi:hypothetical protein K0M31_000495 [Melipona bicolor]|uniref:Uncharacterized protein n=1 Tax=Melipona bicolor TaxID=60889 RepID=A0AA40GDN7_9HYME|nr:hypothetical protein K0M31_000495 [Melipona bicolor]
MLGEMEHFEKIIEKPHPLAQPSHTPYPLSPSSHQSPGTSGSRSSKSSKFQENESTSDVSIPSRCLPLGGNRVALPCETSRNEGGKRREDYFQAIPGPYPSPAKAVPQIGVELSKWPLTTGVRNEERDGETERHSTQTQKGSWNRVVG